MTMALSAYSAIFMRYAFAVTPRNYLLFGCHVVNFSAQVTQGYRYLNYWNFGGREKVMSARAQEGLTKAENTMDRTASQVEGAVKDAASKVESSAKDLAGQAKAQMDKVSR